MAGPGSVKQILEAALLAAGRPLSLDQLAALFGEDERPERGRIQQAVSELQADYTGRGIELAEVGSGFRIQVRAEYAPWVSRLWDEKPGRYSRALMETLALVAYRQPITRGEIEDIRGVSVSTNIIKTLQEREWVRVVGHRDVPGRPALFGTTRTFLDYFGLRSLDELPTLAELRDLDSINRELALDPPGDRTGGTMDGEDAAPDGPDASAAPNEGWTDGLEGAGVSGQEPEAESFETEHRLRPGSEDGPGHA
ncbi:MAG: SMC-Scp complex subunit ScpB [Chromatiales bacterium]|jgi:segregation and condensation protein B